MMGKIKKLIATMAAAVSSVILNVSAYAAEAATSGATGGGGLSGNVAVTGTMKLLNDISNVLLIASPVVGVICIIYFAIRHGAADEMDQKKWKQRIVVAAVCVIVAVVASALLNTIVSYYK